MLTPPVLGPEVCQLGEYLYVTNQKEDKDLDITSNSRPLWHSDTNMLVSELLCLIV